VALVKEHLVKAETFCVESLGFLLLKNQTLLWFLIATKFVQMNFVL
jgi:hypothetical protein